MANTTSSPNMSMPVPTVSEDPGPDWATNIDACLSIIDSHTHASGQGVQITPSGLNMNSDLTMLNNNITNARSLRFAPQNSPLNGASDLGCIYESGVDLYYNDGNGNQVRITQSGSVSGSSGTITGLPSGTASASFAAGTFTFQSATNTPAALAVGPTTIAQDVASGKGVTISASGSQAANYGLALPTALPVSTSYINVDSSGNMGFNTSTGSGSVVLATSPTITTPTFSGIPAGTITSASYSPTVTVIQTGVTVTFTINSSTWSYMRIGNYVTVYGYINFTVTSGSGSNASLWNITIPLSTTSLTAIGGICATPYQNVASRITAFSTTEVRTGPTFAATNVTGADTTFIFNYVIN